MYKKKYVQNKNIKIYKNIYNMICNFCDFQNKLGLLIEEYEKKDDADYEKCSGHSREMGNHFCEDEDCEGFDKGEEEEEDKKKPCDCFGCVRSRVPQYIDFNTFKIKK